MITTCEQCGGLRSEPGEMFGGKPCECRLRSSELVRLWAFYSRIATLTLDHDVIDDHACVTADKLGAALESINHEWWKQPNDKSSATGAENPKL